MPWTVEYLPEKEMIELVAHGAVDNRDARAQAAEIVALVKKHDADHVLADYSRVSLEVSLANLYWLPEYYQEIGAPHHVRAALILPPEAAEIEAYKFYQIACRNAGYNVKLFDSRPAAESWFLQFRARLPASQLEV